MKKELDERNRIVFYTATQISKAIKNKEVSCVEVLEAYLEQFKTINSKLNAIVTIDEESVREQAVKADESIARGELLGPLHGVPITVKDIILTSGIRTTFGIKSRSNFVPNIDAAVVLRLKKAGAIILGKTNVPTGNDIQSSNSLFGKTNNPWNVDYTPGGSSGGGGAAVAAGLSPIDIGSDLGGSIRIPAHCCGIYGLKPTEFRVPSAPPRRIRSIRHMLVSGMLARSIEDLRLSLSIIEQSESVDSDCMDWEVPPQIREKHIEQSIDRYSVAWTDNLGIPIGEGTQHLIKGLTEDISALGCQVEYCKPEDFDFNESVKTFVEITVTESLLGKSAPIRWLSKLLGCIPMSLLSKSPIYQGYIHGSRQNLYRYAEALTRKDYLSLKMDKFLSKWDVWICPVAPGPAFKHQRSGKPIIVDKVKVPYWSWGCSYTSVFSLTGTPVVVIPLGTVNGLPVGLQLVGRRWSDMKLLHIAELISNKMDKYKQPALI
jgi:amidase